MSKPLTPYDRWLSGTNQNSIPANDNSLRSEIFNTDGVADDVTAQPSLSAPDDNGKWYLIPAGATGDQWGDFAENSAAIFYGGTWYEFVPAAGNKVSVDGTPLIFTGSVWDPFVAPSAAVWGGITGDVFDQSDLQSYDIVTEASAVTANPGVHDGLTRLVLAAGDVTFDDAEPYVSGMVFNLRATAAVELLEDGVTLTPPAGGTLELDAGMAVQVIMTSATAGIVIGQTVAAP
jgi:hypothetical protein